MVVIAVGGFIHKGFDILGWHMRPFRCALAKSKDVEGVSILSCKADMHIGEFDNHLNRSGIDPCKAL
jgi:hypothetical protein